MAPCAAAGEMQGVELQFYFCQHIENPPLVTEQGTQNWDFCLVCWDLPFFPLGFWVFFFKSEAGTEAARSCQQGWARLRVCWWCRAASGVLLVWDWWPRGVKRVCSSHLLVKHPQFSQQLCSSSSSGRHRNILTMTFFVLFFPHSPFSIKAIAFWLLSI